MTSTSLKLYRHKKSAKAVCAGFTLIELLMTLAVLVTISAVVMVPIAKWQKSMPLDQSVAMLQQELTTTRLMAIDEATRYAITFDANSNSFNRQSTSASGDVGVQTFQLMPGVRFVFSNDTKATSRKLWFQSDGTVTDSVVVLEDTDGVQTAIKIERLTGIVRVTDVATLAGVAGP